MSVAMIGQYPATTVRLILRSPRHPDVDQSWESALWSDEGVPETWGRRREFNDELPDVDWHVAEVIHGFNDNWLDIDDRPPQAQL